MKNKERKLAEFLTQHPDYPLSTDMIETEIQDFTETMLKDFMKYCESIDVVWAKEFRGWIPEFLEDIR